MNAFSIKKKKCWFLQCISVCHLPQIFLHVIEIVKERLRCKTYDKILSLPKRNIYFRYIYIYILLNIYGKTEEREEMNFKEGEILSLDNSRQIAVA